MKVRRIDFSFDEWIAGTVGMSVEEEGLYIRMIARYYSRGEALPDNPLEIARLCNVRPQMVRRLLPKLLEKFEKTAGKLRQNRCETELKLAENRLISARLNGAKGGRPKDLEKPTGSASVKPITNHHQEKKEKGESNDSPKEKAAALEADFERFWWLYPRRTDKGAARIAYRAARKKTGVAEIETAVRRYAASRDGQDPQYTKHPATWLNREGWLNEDDLPPRENGHARRQSPRHDRIAEAERQHAHALDILAQAALDFDERQGGGGPPKTSD